MRTESAIGLTLLAITGCTGQHTGHTPIRGNKTFPNEYEGAVRAQKNEGLHPHFFCAQSRARTGTSFKGHWILSPTRLPIPPFGQTDYAKMRRIGWILQRYYKKLNYQSVGNLNDLQLRSAFAILAGSSSKITKRTDICGAI